MFKKGDIVRPNGKQKSSKRFELKHLKKGRVININNNTRWDNPKPTITIKILEGHALRYESSNYYLDYEERKFRRATKGQKIVVTQSAFEKLYNNNKELNYPIF